MLTEITPAPKTVAVLYNPSTAPYGAHMVRAVEEAATSIGVVVRDSPCRNDTEIESVMAALAGSSGLVALGDVFNAMHRDVIAAFALKYKVPTVVPTRQMLESGGLISYIIDIPDLYRRSASYIDRILKGEKPANLPVQAPTKFELLINLKTAKSLGITITSPLLDNADEVLE
jgi:putative tryptophan/tyrosine transport system substrate-binding protein